MGGKKILRFCLLGFAVLLVILALIFADTPKEPSYQGRTLTQWIESSQPGAYIYNGSRLSARTDQSIAASNALQQIGSDAIPCLVRWTDIPDSKLQTTVVRWLNSLPSLHLHLAASGSKRRRARMGFELLRTNGSAATTALIKNTHALDPKSRECALQCLEFIEPAHETMFPVCFRLMDDPDSNVRRMASACENDLEMGMTLLSDIKGKQVFLSPLLRWFNDPDRAVRQHSAKLLHFYFPRDAEKAGVYQAFPELGKTATAVNVSQ